MPKPKTDSKLQAKLKNKAFHKGKAGKEGFKGKGKPAAKTAPPVIENTSKFPVLSQLIQDKRSILATEALGKLNFQSKIKLIEELSQYIIMNPENNIMHVQTLLHLSEDDNIIIAKMGLISAAQVFKDCAPLYEINEQKVKEELKKQIAKDERKLVMFEYTFLEGYKKYVGMLSELLKLKPAKFVKSLNIPDLQPEQEEQYINVCKEYNRVALLCLSELISSLFHLNFRKEIAGLVASKLKSFEPELRSIAVKTAKQFFEDQNPASFETKYDFVFGLSKAFGSTPEQKLPDDFLDCLNHLSLQSNLIIQEETEDKKEDKKKADKNKNLNGKRKGKKLEDEKFKEKMKQEKRLKKELKGELKEAEATTDPKRVEYFKTEILMKVFYIYFKILKLQKPSKFLPVAMNGILKFVHLISGDILSDLINTLGGCGELLREYHLKHLTDSKDIFHARVSCVFASIEITSQLGRVVELDDKEAIIMLYQLFLDLCRHPSVAKELTKQDQELMVKGVAKIFIQKRQLSLETTASFIKIFLECSIKLNQEAHGFIKTLLFITKLMIQKYATLNRLLEEDNEGYGFDMYNPNVEDPQATNALRTFIVQDLQNIRKKHPKDADIQTLTKKIEGNEKLVTQISTLTPMEFFRRYNH